MTEPIDLEPYIEQAALVPDGTICTIDIEILRALIEELEATRAERDRWHEAWLGMTAWENQAKRAEAAIARIADWVEVTSFTGRPDLLAILRGDQ